MALAWTCGVRRLRSGGDLNDKDTRAATLAACSRWTTASPPTNSGAQPAFQMRFAKDELRVGIPYGNNPVLANTGVWLVSSRTHAVTLPSPAIFFRPDPQRNRRPGHDHRWRTKEVTASLFGGADYSGIQNTTVNVVLKHEDYYQQFFLSQSAMTPCQSVRSTPMYALQPGGRR